MSIGNEIRNLRKQRGLTQFELAERANISRSYLAGVEGDRYNPSVDTLQKIAAALGTTSGVLLGDASLLELVAVDNGQKAAMATLERQRADAAHDAELTDYLEMLKNRPECRMLFSLTKDASKEDVEKAVAIIEALRKTEGR